ncbi:MAG: YkvA family protein [Longimicrobiales bacterium]
MKRLRRLRRKGRFRQEARAIARVMIANLPNFLRLIVRLLRDARVSPLDKALFGFILVYVLLPADLVPDFLWILGFVDDVYLIGLGLGRMLSRAGPDVLLEHWDGDPRQLGEMVEQVDSVGSILPHRIRRVLTRAVKQAV